MNKTRRVLLSGLWYCAKIIVNPAVPVMGFKC